MTPDVKKIHFPVTNKDTDGILFRIMGTPHKEFETMRIHIELLNDLYEALTSIREAANE